MKVNVISIGNSKGIRIPKALLKQCRIEEQVELEIEEDRIIIKPVTRKPREGWDVAFRLMHDRKEDTLLIEEMIDVEEGNWEWN